MRPCAQCGTPYAPRHPTAKYCGPSCSARHARWHFACLDCRKVVLLPRSRCYGCAKRRRLAPVGCAA